MSAAPGAKINLPVVLAMCRRICIRFRSASRIFSCWSDRTLAWASIIFMIEAQVNDALRTLRDLCSSRKKCLDVRRDVLREFNDLIQKSLTEPLGAAATAVGTAIAIAATPQFGLATPGNSANSRGALIAPTMRWNHSD